MLVLGLDVGSKRIGVAKSDESGMFSHGVQTVESDSVEYRLNRVVELIEAYSITKVVIGYPLNMDGTAGRQARYAEQFANHIRKKAAVEVILWDERLTSSEAETYLLEGDLSRKKRKKVIDKLAAQILLQSYLDSQRKGT